MIDMAQSHKSTTKRIIKRHEGGQQRGAGFSKELMDVKKFPMTLKLTDITISSRA